MDGGEKADGQRQLPSTLARHDQERKTGFILRRPAQVDDGHARANIACNLGAGLSHTPTPTPWISLPLGWLAAMSVRKATTSAEVWRSAVLPRASPVLVLNAACCPEWLIREHIVRLRVSPASAEEQITRHTCKVPTQKLQASPALTLRDVYNTRTGNGPHVIAGAAQPSTQVDIFVVEKGPSAYQAARAGLAASSAPRLYRAGLV